MFSRIPPRILIVAFAVLLFSASELRADVDTYTYTGNDFTNFSGSVTCPSDCSVDGSFTVSSLLAAGTTTTVSPTAFDFYIATEDTPTWTNLNGAVIEHFTVTTNSMGQITGWAIELESSGGNPDVGTFTTGDDVEFTLESVGDNMNAPGTWNGPLAPTPEPKTFLLFITGLMLVGIVTRTVRRRIAAERQDVALN
jgi:hypothetical protein